MNQSSLIVGDQLNEWSLTSGLLYWAGHCPGGEILLDAYIRRTAVNGTLIRTLTTTTVDHCMTFYRFNADADGVYYYNPPTFGDLVDGLYFRPVDEPYGTGRLLHAVNGDVPNLETRLLPQGAWLYWIAGTQIRRVPKDGSGFMEGAVVRWGRG